MSTAGSRSRRQGTEERGRAGKPMEKSKSFSGRMTPASVKVELRRPKTQPDLFSGRSAAAAAVQSSPTSGSLTPRLTKILVNVTVKGSLGPVHVVMSLESTVGELVDAAVRKYEKEGRRPLLPAVARDGFDLHYSQFSLESLDQKEKLINLGSRNFFLCEKAVAAASRTPCSTEAEKVSAIAAFPGWLKFMSFLL